MTATRKAIVTVHLKDEADTCLTWDVEYNILGKYRRATLTEPEEYPELDVHSAKLVEVNECEPSADDRAHHESEWDGIYWDKFRSALWREDAIKYPELWHRP